MFNTDSSFDMMAMIFCTTKRAPAVTAGKRGVAVENVAAMQTTPIDPVDATIAARAGLSTPAEGYVTFTKEPDVLEGDILLQDTRQFVIRAVWDFDNWTLGGDWKQLVLEQLKAT